MIGKTILVISEGPPPLGSTGVEGGGLRAWGLAKALAHHGFQVTFAYRSTFALADDHERTSIPDGVKVDTWDGTNLKDIIDNHRIIVMRYAMGEALHIISCLSDSHILVSDNYIPISVEVAARQSDDPNELTNYLRLQKSSLRATRRADYILYASDTQYHYYVGYLAGINKLNPKTYGELEKRMFKVPYGVDPSEKVGRAQSRPDKPTLLWYGAFYSWFDMESLVESLKELKKDVPGFRMVIAGAQNPYNKDPGLLAHYNRTMKALEPIKDIIELVPWGPFDERFVTYAKSSAIITWNHDGLENKFAWRTRLMDFILAERPIITNGGDPLAEDLIRRGVAFKADLSNIKSVFEKVIHSPPSKKTYDAAAHDYSWEVITKELAHDLETASRMVSADMELTGEARRAFIGKAKLGIKSPYLVVRSIKKHGVKGAMWKVKAKLGR